MADIRIDTTSLNAASAATTDWPRNCGGRTEISYNSSTGEVFTRDLIGENYVVYDDPDVHAICSATRHMSAARIRKEIMREMERLAMAGRIKS